MWFSIVWALTAALLNTSSRCILIFFCGGLTAATWESAPPAVNQQQWKETRLHLGVNLISVNSIKISIYSILIEILLICTAWKLLFIKVLKNTNWDKKGLADYLNLCDFFLVSVMHLGSFSWHLSFSSYFHRLLGFLSKIFSDTYSSFVLIIKAG